MRWEYTVLTRTAAGFFRTNGERIQPGANALNTLGDEGWELVSVRDDLGEVVHYFKRPAEVAVPVKNATPSAVAYNWTLLHNWLYAQERENYHAEGGTYHTGLFEGRCETAHILKDLPAEMPAEQKLAALYRHLETTLKRTESPEEEQD